MVSGCVLKGHSYLRSYIPSTHKPTPPPRGVLHVMLVMTKLGTWQFGEYVLPKENKHILVGCYHLGMLQMTYVDCSTVRWCLR